MLFVLGGGLGFILLGEFFRFSLFRAIGFGFWVLGSRVGFVVFIAVSQGKARKRERERHWVLGRV